jgi:CRISPR-associated protein Csb1
MSDILSHYDAWLSQGGPSALILKERLQPAAGPGAVVFPPTYAGEGYVIDGEGGNNVCLFDSVGSQANRLEPVFKLDKYKSLVPQITIRVGERSVSLLDVGHRAADALVRSSSLAQEIQTAFAAYDNGDAAPLARIAPTTLVFGAWDSRGTQAKVPRLVDASIHAHNLTPLRRGAQYFSALSNDEVNELVGEVAKQKDALSEAGFLDAPSLAHGGVIVKGPIIRTAILNLTALRALGGSQELRRYILSLALVAALAPDDLFLRQGCLLVRDAEHPLERKLVFRTGETKEFADAEQDVEEYAVAAASAFGVGENRDVPFDPKLAKAILETNAQKKPKKAK